MHTKIINTQKQVTSHRLNYLSGSDESTLVSAIFLILCNRMAEGLMILAS